ncbi:O-antigen ligase family protein [Elongatibacter sediminis]|uniref:O-antigen ligase family protein n=1 Tax=Elongatibacter sediminis TaxID=3119006 RepID=UPI00339D82DB
MNRSIFPVLMLLVAIAPLPLGSNREWAWSICAAIVGVLGLLWGLSLSFNRSSSPSQPNPWIVLAFVFACIWVVVQQAAWVPASWKHPLWGMTSTVLARDVADAISVNPHATVSAMMRLLTYALSFMLAFHLGRERERALAAFGWIAMAGLVYGIFGLAVYWSGYHPGWLFGDRVLPEDVRSTFVNRNHFATWQGLSLLVAMAYYYQRLSRPPVKPYQVPMDRAAAAEEFIRRAWMPLAALLLMSSALILTHSRGGFVAAVAGTLVLVYLLDRRGRRHRAASRVTVIAAVGVASLAFFLTSEVLLERINHTDITTEERLAVYADVTRGISDNPLLGFGYGTFSDSFRMYNQVGTAVHYDRAHNTWLENAFELGLPAAVLLYAALAGLALICLGGVSRRHRDWVFPATGVAASVLVAMHSMVDFSLQIPAVAILYACIMGVCCAQAYSSSAGVSGFGHATR